MKGITLIMAILTWNLLLTAQIYTNASSNLPDNGAKGQSMDVRAADIDGDDDLDIILANEFKPNTILINDGNGIFSNGTSGNLPQSVHDSEDVAIADFNQDGHLDLIFCSEDDVTLGWTNVHEYYFGDGQGGFSLSGINLPDSEANAVITEDINNDNIPDLLFGNNGPTTLLVNNGDGTFTDESSDRIPALQKTTQDLLLFDADGDNDLDLFEGNENGNALFINNGSGVFDDSTSSNLPQGLNIETRKVSAGDVDADGDLDLFLSNVAFIPGKNPQNRLFINDGSGKFTDASDEKLPADSDHTIDGIFEDTDLDGDLDIVVANVFGGKIKIYENDGEGLFTDQTADQLGTSYILDALGVIAADFNNDGLRDLYICDRNTGTGNKDLLLIRSPVTTISNATNSSEKALVYPNPVTSVFFVKLPFQLKKALIVDSSGKTPIKLSFEKIEKGLFQLQLPENEPSFTPGLYVLSFKGKKESLQAKVFIR